MNSVCTNERDHLCEKWGTPENLPTNDPLPISYSDWLKHGEKYKYTEFFKKRILEEVQRKTIDAKTLEILEDMKRETY